MTTKLPIEELELENTNIVTHNSNFKSSSLS